MRVVREVGWRGIGVAVHAPRDVLEAIFAQLPPFFDGKVVVHGQAIVSRSCGGLRADLPDGLDVDGPDDAETARAIASRIELFVAGRLPGVAVVHAGVVAVDERAIVVPGSSMAGKSTLVGALLDAGAQYLSDEFALLGADGSVAAYPRRTTMRSGGGSERSMPANARDVDAATIPVAVIAGLSFDPVSAHRAYEITSAQAVLMLMENSVNARRAPDVVLRALSAAATEARCVRGPRGEAVQAAQWLIELAQVAGPPVS